MEKIKKKEIPTSVAMRTKEQSSKCCPPDQVRNGTLNPITESDLGEIVLYQPEGDVRLEVRVENDTVWLTQAQMAELFSKSISVISRHISNVFAEHELEEKGNLHFLQIANSDKPVKFFSLDVIISVDYRVKSFRGTQFRRWANKVLRDYMLKSYAVNQRMVSTGMRIANQFQEHRQMIENQGAEIKDVRKSVAEHKCNYLFCTYHSRV